MTAKIANYPLEQEAELALYDLSLTFELEEGKRFKWRKSPHQLFMMIDEAFNSQTLAMARKAIHFFKIVPYEIQHEFISRRILPPTEEQLTKRFYRGIENKPEDTQPQQQRKTNSVLHYRGVAIDKTSAEQKDAQMFTHTKKVKRVWRGVTTYVDE